MTFNQYIKDNYESDKTHFLNYCTNRNYYGFDFEEVYQDSVFKVIDTTTRNNKIFEDNNGCKGYLWIVLRNELKHKFTDLYTRKEDQEETIKHSFNNEEEFYIFNDDNKILIAPTPDDEINIEEKYEIDDAYANIFQDIKTNIKMTNTERIVLMTYFMAKMENCTIKKINEEYGLVDNYRQIWYRVCKKIRNYYNTDLSKLVEKVRDSN